MPHRRRSGFASALAVRSKPLFRNRLFRVFTTLPIAALLAGAPAVADDARLAPCLACHGANGQSHTPGVPSLGGQPEFYLLTQLFLFREDRRNGPQMVAAARGLSDSDMTALAARVAQLPPPAPPSGGRDDALYARGQAAVRTHRCGACHGVDLAGGAQVPRLANQREEYLLEALRGYKRGKRLGYTPAMAEVMSSVDAAELPALAHYLFHFSPAAED